MPREAGSQRRQQIQANFWKTVTCPLISMCLGIWPNPICISSFGEWALEERLGNRGSSLSPKVIELYTPRTRTRLEAYFPALQISSLWCIWVQYQKGEICLGASLEAPNQTGMYPKSGTSLHASRWSVLTVYETLNVNQRGLLKAMLVNLLIYSKRTMLNPLQKSTTVICLTLLVPVVNESSSHINTARWVFFSPHMMLWLRPRKQVAQGSRVLRPRLAGSKA